MPAFNEVEVIADVVGEARRALDELTADSEIVVVDDGSTDGTGARLDELAAAGQVRVLHSPENRGYGWAVRAGYAMATRPLVFFTDSDGQFDAMELGLLLPLVTAADIVVGHRVGRRDGSLRAALSAGYNTLVRTLLGVEVRDINCAFKLMRRDALERLRLVSNGYVINAELMARATRAGLRIREAPVSHRPRRAGRSKVSIADVPSSLRQLLLLRRLLGQSPAE